MGYFKEDMEVWFGTNEWEPMDGFTFWRKTAVQFLVNPGVMAVAMHRAARFLYEKNLIFPSQVMDRLTEFFTGAQIPGQTEIGPGFRVYHPNGLVISPPQFTTFPFSSFTSKKSCWPRLGSPPM